VRLIFAPVDPLWRPAELALQETAMRSLGISLVAAAVLGASDLACVKSEAANLDSAATDAAARVCSVEAPTSCPDPSPHYGDVAPIINQRCVEPCHSGLPGGPWPLTDYAHVADWADVVRDDLILCLMPPADGGISMSEEEKLAILTWIRCGSLE
jgi:hypothetical protein